MIAQFIVKQMFITFFHTIWIEIWTKLVTSVLCRMFWGTVKDQWSCKQAVKMGKVWQNNAVDTIFGYLQLPVLNLIVIGHSLRSCAFVDHANDFSSASLNPSVINAPFLYPLKKWENLTVFWWISGGRERVHWEQMG